MQSTVYRERVLPSIGTFALPLLLFVFLYAVLLPVDEASGVIFGALAAISLTTLLILRAPVIEVTASELKVGRASIPRKLIGEVLVVTEEEAFAERGHRLDSRAFTSFQSSVKTLVRAEITDKSDPTPYWLFSSRNPARIKELLG